MVIIMYNIYNKNTEHPPRPITLPLAAHALRGVKRVVCVQLSEDSAASAVDSELEASAGRNLKKSVVSSLQLSL